MGISESSVYRIWRVFNPQPSRAEDLKIWPDPLLIDKILDVVAHVASNSGECGGLLFR